MTVPPLRPRRGDVLASRPTGDAAAAVRPRDPYFDNAKFLAVALVVVGHAWEPLRGARAVDAAHLLVYAFHLPVFIVIAGHLSQRFDLAPGRVRKLVAGLLVPYLVFEAAYSLLATRLRGHAFTWSPFDPYYLTWFLPALALWRVSVPLWKQARWPLALALVGWLVAGALRLPQTLAVDRALSFLPFFVLGLRLTPAHFAALRRPAVRVAGLLALLTAAAIAYRYAARIDPEWVHWRRGYAELHVSVPVGMALRLLAFGCALALTAAFLALVPARRTWFTGLGSGTMYTYLLHGFLVVVAAYSGWYDPAHSRPGVLVVTLLAVVVAVALATPLSRRVFRPLVEPRLTWLFPSRT